MPYRASVAHPLRACTRSPVPLFLTFALYALCPRFDSFDSFAMERENAAKRPGSPRLANDVKVRSNGRIWATEIFLFRAPSRAHFRRPPPAAAAAAMATRARLASRTPDIHASTPSVHRLNVVINCYALKKYVPPLDQRFSKLARFLRGTNGRDTFFCLRRERPDGKLGTLRMEINKLKRELMKWNWFIGSL